MTFWSRTFLNPLAFLPSTGILFILQQLITHPLYFSFFLQTTFLSLSKLLSCISKHINFCAQILSMYFITEISIETSSFVTFKSPVHISRRDSLSIFLYILYSLLLFEREKNVKFSFIK